MLDFVSLLDNNDTEGIRNLFAEGKIENVIDFDQSMVDLFDYYQGNYNSIVKYGSPGVSKDKHYEFEATYYNMSYDIKTSADIYRLAMYWCSEYTTDPNFIGLWSFYIIKLDDDNSDSFYRGDGFWTPGINIGKVSNPKYE